METYSKNQDSYNRAKKRVKDIQGFYHHLIWYLVINIFLTFRGAIYFLFKEGSFHIAEINFDSMYVWLFWGIGLAAHWFQAFGKNIIFTKEWETRKINELVNNDDSKY